MSKYQDDVVYDECSLHIIFVTMQMPWHRCDGTDGAVHHCVDAILQVDALDSTGLPAIYVAY